MLFRSLSSLALSLACLAAELIACPSLASWTLCAFSYLFQPSRIMCVLFHLEIPCKCAKHFVFFFIKVEPFVLFFPRFLKLLCFLDRSCSRHCRCSVTLSIWLSSEESIQTINCQKSALYFLLDVFEAFVFGNSSFALGFDKTLTPGQLTPLLTPLLTPYKINGKMKIAKPRTIDETRFKFINKFSLPETSKMAVALQISDSLLI